MAVSLPSEITDKICEAVVYRLEKEAGLFGGQASDGGLLDFIEAFENFHLPSEYVKNIPDGEAAALKQDVEEALLDPDGKFKKGFASKFYIPSLLATLKGTDKKNLRAEDLVSGLKGTRTTKRLYFLRETLKDVAANVALTDADPDAIKVSAYALAIQPKVSRMRWTPRTEEMAFNMIFRYMAELGVDEASIRKYIKDLRREFEKMKRRPVL